MSGPPRTADDVFLAAIDDLRLITSGAPHLDRHRRKQPQLDSRPLKLEQVLLYWASAGLGSAFNRWRLGCSALDTQAADEEAFVHRSELRKAHMLVQSAMTQQAQQAAAWQAKLDHRGGDQHATPAADARVAALEAELRAAKQQLARSGHSLPSSLRAR